MSNVLSIDVVWAEPLGDPQQVAEFKVDCTDNMGNHFRSTPLGDTSFKVNTEGYCQIEVLPASSDVELLVDGACEGYIDVREGDVACQLDAWGFNVGVPMLNGAGFVILIAGLFALAAWKLSRM